jgi:hypothetical protein
MQAYFYHYKLYSNIDQIVEFLLYYLVQIMSISEHVTRVDNDEFSTLVDNFRVYVILLSTIRRVVRIFYMSQN